MKRKVLLQTAALLILAGGLVGVGWLLGGGPWHTVDPDAPELHASASDGGLKDSSTTRTAEHKDEEQHVHLTRQAYQNLQLQMGRVQLEDYVRTIRIPGEVVEIPGRSSRSVVAPVTGVVHRIYVEPGQVVPCETPLMEMEITDEALISGQVALLDGVSRLEVTRRELSRLGPLAESGTIARSRRLELEYEAQQYEAQLAARIQELTLRGLTTEQIASVQEDRKLVQRIAVRLPSVESLPGADPIASNSKSHAVISQPGTVESTGTAPADAIFTIEHLGVHPGMSVERGDEMCRLADHRRLYIRGEAFEEDVAAIAGLREQDWSVAAEFGHQHALEHQHRERREGLNVVYVDNHVDRETRTFHFYLRLMNEVAEEYQSDSKVTFREWRFKPGQLAHLFVPVEEWQRQIKLPLAAVVEEGPTAFVFRSHQEPKGDGRAATRPGEHADEVFIEFEPVEVHLLHKDSNHAVLADDGQLRLGDEVALNRAYQLHLAMKMQSGEGGHHHHHEH